MKTALVTGGSGGIGTAICIALAQSGYNVVINFNKNKKQAEKLSKIIEDSYSVKTLAIGCDVSDYPSVAEMFSVVSRQFGGADVLVNNSGIASQQLVTDVTPEQWREMMGVNLDGVFYCCKEALPYMISQKQGIIINISSMWGQTGASCEVAYSASKAGVIGFTKALAKEVGLSGIRVNCVAPGVIMTDMMNSFDENVLEELKEETPLNTLGTPKDVADCVAFLASDRAKFITGQVFGVNGGFVI